VKISLPEDMPEVLSLAEVVVEASVSARSRPSAVPSMSSSPSSFPIGNPSLTPSINPTSTPSISLAGNIALDKPAEQSSTGAGGVPERAVDGDTNGNYYDGSVTATNEEPGPWWKVDLLNFFDIERIVIFNRQDCCGSRLSVFIVTIYNQGEEVWTYQSPDGVPPYETIIDVPNIEGDEVKVSLPEEITEVLSLAEVAVLE